MPKSKKKKEEEVLISLEDNQKRKVNNNDGDFESDSDLKDKKKLKKRDNLNDEPRIFLCNLCHNEDASKPRFKKSEVKLDLSEKEQEVLQFRYKTPVKIVCLQHYETEVKFWFLKNTKVCKNLFGRHKSASKNKLWTQEIDLETAKKANKYTSYDLIPCQRLCKVCFKQLQEEIKSAMEIENNIVEDDIANTAEEDVGNAAIDEAWIEDLDDDEDDNKDLKEIINNIKDNWPEYSKDQRIALIQVLPKKWSIKKIGDLTGLSKRLGKI